MISLEKYHDINQQHSIEKSQLISEHFYTPGTGTGFSMKDNQF
jgi:hypothetical protein